MGSVRSQLGFASVGELLKPRAPRPRAKVKMPCGFFRNASRGNTDKFLRDVEHIDLDDIETSEAFGVRPELLVRRNHFAEDRAQAKLRS
jgi:hypothetical protein